MNENDMNAFWERISEIEYVVLRNHENIIEDLMSGGDIDILVDNKMEFVKATNAISLNKYDDGYNYYVVIGQKKVPIDLREVGDGYYDRRWEHDMLKNRRKKDGFYVLDDESYRYSIFYHCLIHKKKISEKYICFMKQHGLNKKKQLIRSLDKYMRNSGYKYVIPKDFGVEFNKPMYYRRRIKNYLKGF